MARPGACFYKWVDRPVVGWPFGALRTRTTRLPTASVSFASGEGARKKRNFMNSFAILFRRLKNCVFYALALAVTLQPLPVIAQSFCGPQTLVNFNGINGH